MTLEGLSVVVTRPNGQEGEMVELLRERGAAPVHIPAISIRPSEDEAFRGALRGLSRFDWVVFTSSNGVHAAFQALEEEGISSESLLGRNIAVIGPGTEKALTAHGGRAAAMPERYLTEELPSSLGDVRGKKVLLARADIAREVLVQELEQRGALVHDVSAYVVKEGEERGSFDALNSFPQGYVPQVITFTSPSTFRGLSKLLKESGREEWLNRAALASVGPVTTEEIERHGYHSVLTASEHTARGLVDALEVWRREAV